MRYRFALRSAIIITVAAVWLAACIPAQALSQFKLVSTVRKKIGPQGPTYIFKLYSVESLSNYHYQIEVCDEGGRIVFRSEVIRNGVRLEGQRGGFQVVDLNSDSYADVKVLGGYSEGRAWHKVWLYDPSTQKLSGITELHSRRPRRLTTHSLGARIARPSCARRTAYDGVCAPD